MFLRIWGYKEDDRIGGKDPYSASKGMAELAIKTYFESYLSYKPNVKDIQLTPAEEIIKKLQDLGAKIQIFDPYFKSQNVFGITVLDNIENIIPKVNASIIVTAHDEFKKLEIDIFSKMINPILIDTRGIIEPMLARNKKLIFRGLGRG